MLEMTPDPLALWEAELRALVVTDLPADTVGSITTAALGVSLATAATATTVALQGGATMTGATIGATAASNIGAKITAGCLAAALAVGGTAAVTGNLPDSAQKGVADAAARIGLTLPQPAAEEEARPAFDAQAATVVDVGVAGRVHVTLDGDGLVLAGTDANAGFTAHVVAEGPKAIVVEFRGDTETVSVLLTNIAGSISASVTTKAHATGDAGATGGDTGSGKGVVDASVGGSARAEGSAGASSGGCGCESGGAEAEAEAEAEIGIGIRVGG